jgi:serine/threonine protein kinase
MSFLSDDALEHLRRVTEQPDLSATRYRLEHELGRGGMGIVYQAWDTSLERSVALKVIDALSAAEPRILARLEHPGLVPVYDAGSLPDGRLYYAMRLVHGRRLDQYLRAGESLPARLRLFVRICEAVAFAHDCGVIHRDLKPQNIMAGSFGEVFVMDWGIARSMDDSELPPSAGTPPYAAPEASPDRRADVYSLGRILEDIVRGSENRPLAAVIRRATDPDPSARYADVPQLAEDVTRFLDGLPVTAYRESPWERSARFVRRNQVLLLLIAAFLVVKFALFFLSRR